MTKIFHAIFDGKVLRPDEPIGLEQNTRVRLTIQAIETPSKKSRSFFDTARSLKLKGPVDWSERFENYLYRERDNGDQ